MRSLVKQTRQGKQINMKRVPSSWNINRVASELKMFFDPKINISRMDSLCNTI